MQQSSHAIMDCTVGTSHIRPDQLFNTTELHLTSDVTRAKEVHRRKLLNNIKEVASGA